LSRKNTRLFSGNGFGIVGFFAVDAVAEEVDVADPEVAALVGVGAAVACARVSDQKPHEIESSNAAATGVSSFSPTDDIIPNSQPKQLGTNQNPHFKLLESFAAAPESKLIQFFARR
jgi:hypothetical protein